MDGFSVNNAIPHMAEEMRAQTKGIMDALDDLRAKLRPMAETWTGDAATMWGTVQSSWSSATGDMQERFGRAYQTLNQSYDNYRSTDAQISSKFSNM